MVWNHARSALDLAHTRLSLSRRLSDYAKVRRVVGHLIRGNRLFHPQVAPGAYVHLGCGPNVLPSFLNIDYNWIPGIDMCCDIARGIPIGDEVAGGIYSEHCLEHLTIEQCRGVLKECRRVMQPGSVLRISVPDLETYARAYVQHLDDNSTVLPNEYFVNTTGMPRSVALFNELFTGSGHRFIYDHDSLAALLRESGFDRIDRCAFRKGSDARLLVDTPGRASESLYIEAIKH